MTSRISASADRYLRAQELGEFVGRVSYLREQQLSTRDIAHRLGVPVSTMNERLRKHRQLGMLGAGEQNEGARPHRGRD